MSNAPPPPTNLADQPEDVLDTGEAGGRAIRGGALFTASYVVGLLLSLASAPFMIRHLGVVDYGYYVAVSAIIFIIGGFTEAGLTNLGIREYSQLRAEEREAFLRDLVGLRLALTTAGVLVAIALTAATGSPSVVVAGVAIAGLGLLVQLTQQTYSVPLTVQLRMGWISILGVMRQVTLSGLFIALVLLNAGLIAFFWANVVMGVVAVSMTIVLIRGTAPLLPRFHAASWKRILRQTLPYALAAAVGLIYFRIAVVLMSYVSTDEETGIFSAAFRIVEVVGVLPWLLVSAGFPILARAARDDEQRLGYALQKIFEVAVVLGVFLGLGLAVAAPLAIEVVAGKAFDASVPVLRLQAAGLVTSFLMVTWTYALLSLKLYRPLLIANAAAAVVAIVATVLLAPPFGAEGAAIATVMAEAILALFSLAGLRRHRPALTPDLAVVPKVIAAFAVALAVALLVPAPVLVLSVLAGGAYGVVVLLLGAVPPEAIAALRRRA
jgi:O-antigen/teichoic acid export membrane protein